MLSPTAQYMLLALQAFQVAFLWLHDWIPLGRLNDVQAVQRMDSRRRLVAVTLMQSVPFTVGLLFTIFHLDGPWPHWLWQWLFVSYGILFIGQLRAWWVPYLIRPDTQRTVRYRVMFGNTHSFLPVRNGIAPNTLHIILHVATVVTLTVLLFAHQSQ